MKQANNKKMCKLSVSDIAMHKCAEGSEKSWLKLPTAALTATKTLSVGRGEA